MIIGSVGSGKSTLGTHLSRLLALPVIHLDLIVWQPGCRTIPDEEFVAIHTDLLVRDAWIIEGVGPWQTWAARVAAADTIILPDYSVWQSWYWVAKRQLTAIVKRRHPAPPDCPILPMTVMLLRWVWIYRREMRPAIEAIIGNEDNRHRTILRFHDPAMMRRCLQELADDRPAGGAR
jgi:adenylate kinase family enzyme